jgi:hypothetical protein
LTAAAAKAEAGIRLGDGRVAVAVLREIGPTLSKYVSDTHTDNPDAFIEALSVADRVAERLE